MVHDPDEQGITLALYQPDIAANAGAALRLATCLALPMVIVEPCGFVWDDRRLRRAGLDYLDQARVTRQPSWSAFEAWCHAAGRRLVLLSTRGRHLHHVITYQPGDVLLAGRESAGVPDEVHRRAELTVRIPIAEGARSLNMVTALAIVAGEALRQTDNFPPSSRSIDDVSNDRGRSDSMS